MNGGVHFNTIVCIARERERGRAGPPRAARNRKLRLFGHCVNDSLDFRTREFDIARYKLILCSPVGRRESRGKKYSSLLGKKCVELGFFFFKIIFHVSFVRRKERYIVRIEESYVRIPEDSSTRDDRIDDSSCVYINRKKIQLLDCG